MSKAGKREVGYSVEVSGWNWVAACGRGGGLTPSPPTPRFQKGAPHFILSLANSSPESSPCFKSGSENWAVAQTSVLMLSKGCVCSLQQYLHISLHWACFPFDWITYFYFIIFIVPLAFMYSVPGKLGIPIINHWLPRQNHLLPFRINILMVFFFIHQKINDMRKTNKQTENILQPAAAKFTVANLVHLLVYLKSQWN